ncbi:MAG TPA: ATP-binding protein [Trebonia sp.]|nr:ATP-binding protein [Trebonia sp.]
MAANRKRAGATVAGPATPRRTSLTDSPAQFPTPPGQGLPGRGRPLPAPAGDAVYHVYRSDLSKVRVLVRKQARKAGLAEGRANDLVLAVSEVAANTLRHTGSPGTLAIWRDGRQLVCQVQDAGVITDPLAGQRKPGLDAAGGHGLWLVNQLCDQVELASGADGTTIRMHMDLPSPREAP